MRGEKKTTINTKRATKSARGKIKGVGLWRRRKKKRKKFVLVHTYTHGCRHTHTHRCKNVQIPIRPFSPAVSRTQMRRLECPFPKRAGPRECVYVCYCSCVAIQNGRFSRACLSPLFSFSLTLDRFIRRHNVPKSLYVCVCVCVSLLFGN